MDAMGRHRPRAQYLDDRLPDSSVTDTDAALTLGPAARVTEAPPVTQAAMLGLQRTAGNAAVSRLAGRALQRTTVNTNGGVFDNAPMYNTVAGTGKAGERVGANIMIDFTAGDLVEAPASGIALIQSVKGMTDRKPDGTLGAAKDQKSFASDNEDDRARFNAGGVGIDVPIHPGGRDEPNNNPIYGAGFTTPAPSARLGDVAPSLGRTQLGSHVRDPGTGALLPPVKAQMEDGPGRVLEVDGQSFEMTFEVTALVTSGPMQDTYLGSVEWGWSSDASGNVTLKPFAPVASGAPTSTFMGAASTWNAAIFHDQSFWGTLAGDTTDSVDLPITTIASGAKAAVDMTTQEIITRLPVVGGQVSGLPAGAGVDRTNQEFEQRALATELAKRKIVVTLICGSISDTGGAASPAEDEVWLSLEGGKEDVGMTLTGTRTFTAGDAHAYEFPITDFLPLTKKVHIDVNEHDRAGPGGRASDDVLVALDWLPPFAPVVTADKGGHYTAIIGFDK
jgi:hypothetical protein